MSELLFPVVGALVVFFVLVPALTLAARTTLAFGPTTNDRVSAQESSWRLLLVLSPTLGPLVWLISASIHQTEEGAALAACIVDHLSGEQCSDVVLFGTILLAVLGHGALRRARREQRTKRDPDPTSDREAATARVQELCRRDAVLFVSSASRIRVVDRGVAPACTRGLLRPRIEIEAALAMRFDDDELKATLLHELEHAHARDPLRFFVAHVALSINPLGSLLAPELARYHFAREALCDKRAVQHGADPLALARSIVSVAAPKGAPATVPALGGHGIGGVRLRVQLLLGYAACLPGPAARRTPIGVVAVLVALAAMSPHLLGAGPLDLFHQGVERAALHFGLG